MKHNKDKKHLAPEEEKAMFSNLEFSYSRSKEEVWSQMEGMMDEEEDAPVVAMPSSDDKKVKSISWKWMSVAASLLILLSAGLFARLYTITVSVAPGEFVSHTLPDGSEVHLNAATRVSYKPYWWRFSRGVDMQGEAYFVVAKGEKFTVNAVMGSVEVLGTEFNVYARGDDFQVYCEEGRVKVTSEMLVQSSQKEVILTKGNVANIELNRLNNGVLLKQVDNVPNQAILSWRTGQFLYDVKPLSKVFEDLERQYGVSILLSESVDEKLGFSGAFERELPLEKALKIICLPMGLEYETVQDQVYKIRPVK